MLRLPRLTLLKLQVMPLGARAPHSRFSSPPGDSTLMTSAPWSARSCAQYGPARTRLRSSTRNPCNGRPLSMTTLGRGAGLAELPHHARDDLARPQLHRGERLLVVHV